MKFKFKNKEKLSLSVVILNWNRLDLLRGTFYSLLVNTSYPIEKIVIVDNASDDGSVIWLRKIYKIYPKLVDLVLNNKNKGGESINLGLEKINSDLVLISENDLEYLPNWQQSMLEAFRNFPDLAQLSPFSPFPQVEMGEVWEKKPYSKILNYKKFRIYETTENSNVGTTCVVRKSAIKNVKWKTRTDNTSGNNFKFPDDGQFSQDLKQQGYKVAWAGDYLTINWGHNLYTWLKDQRYYSENYEAKPWLGIKGLNQRLKSFGYKYEKGVLGKIS